MARMTKKQIKEKLKTLFVQLEEIHSLSSNRKIKLLSKGIQRKLREIIEAS